MKIIRWHSTKLGILILFFVLGLNAQTTGKIAGKVIDSKTKEALPGVNIIVQGTGMGAASDESGAFYIINLRPGSYDIIVQMIGYEKLTITGVRVSVNRTSNLNISLNETILTGQEVIVEADMISVKKDQTSSVRHMNSETIEMMPVENVNSLVNMQAGVVNGHFRGGRSTEVSYMIDGVQVDDSFGGVAQVVGLEAEAVEDLEVITGTFNAEYGRAMSGVVNAVTKEGGKHLEISFGTQMGNYYTSHNSIFLDMNSSDFMRNQDYKFQIGGPVIKNKLSFFANYRFQDNLGYLNGIRRFNVDDYSNFILEPYYSEQNGDSAYVAMNDSKNISLMGKLTFKPVQNIKLNILYTLNDSKWRGYRHEFKYNPDGLPYEYSQSQMLSFSINHMISNKLFYEIKYSGIENYYGNYMFEDPRDSGYVHDIYLDGTGPGFYTGGMSKIHNERTLNQRNFKFDINWQINMNHSIKTGLLTLNHDVDYAYRSIRNLYEGNELEQEYYFDYLENKFVFPNYEPVVFPDSSVYSDIYTASPSEYSLYIQDKMEFDEMVINAGIRYDYFDPNTVYPSDRRNPSNQLLLPDSMMSVYPASSVKTQISPRFGLAYQLSDVAVLRFSYGHFFQMPPLYALYQNHSFRIAPGDYVTLMGNSELEAEKTITYEIGLWQELTDGMGLEVALFYKDIYDLLSVAVVSTYNQIEYGLYTNKDYGNARGMEIKWDFSTRNFYSNINYTLQYTRGNADNAYQTFTRSGDSMDPIKKLIPMSWDQRHTFNLTLGYRKEIYGITMTGYYNSGTPYTFTPVSESQLANINLSPNNDTQPMTYSVDLTGFYALKISEKFSVKFTLSVYNLFDRLNSLSVYGDTGLPYSTIVRESDILNHHSDFNDYYDRIKNPSMYSAPRYIKIGMSVDL